MQLEGVLRVDSFPGRLESESILFASGLDLFATRISPSRSFDVLSPAFNKVQLVVTITLLSLALGWTQNMVRDGSLGLLCLVRPDFGARRSRGDRCGKSGTLRSTSSIYCNNQMTTKAMVATETLRAPP